MMSAAGVVEKENSVKSQKTTPFSRKSLEEKLRVIELGPDQPDIKIEQQSKDRGRNYTCSFSRSWFSKKGECRLDKSFPPL